MQFSNTVTINRSAADVFAFLSRFENLPLWNYAIRETRRTDSGPDGVGARYRQLRTIPRTAVETFEVTDLDPDRTVAIRGVLGPFHAESHYQLRETGDATVLTNTMKLDLPGRSRLATTLTMRRVRAAVAGNLSTLKNILEHDTPGTSA